MLLLESWPAPARRRRRPKLDLALHAEDVLAAARALTDLERHYPEHSRVIELRFFGGLNIEKTAEVLGLSHATVERHWKFARAWLRNKMRQ